MSLLLENSHAMHFQTMPHVHYPIPKDRIQTLARLCKKIHGCGLSDKENQATSHSLQIFSNKHKTLLKQNI